jgi:hypothetical protein
VILHPELARRARQSGHGVLDGIRAPLVILRRARAAGFLPDYLRYVRKQAILVLLAMAVIGPMTLAPLHKLDQKSHEIAAKHTASKHRVSKHKAVKHDDDENEDDDDANESSDDERVDTTGFFPTHFPWLFSIWIWLAAAYGLWFGVEWTIAFLWKEHGEVLSDELSRAIGQAPETPQLGHAPRVRVDFSYLRLKLRRTIRNAIMFASGAPFFFLARAIPVVGGILSNSLLIAWTIYWWVVTTAAKSELAWRSPAPEPPWFLRGWDFLTTRVPGFRWFLPRWYGRVWSRATKRLHGAAVLVEDAPAELLGLSIVRILGDAPLLSIAVRPLLPIGATTVATRGQNVGPPESA